jgi:hypothetical protein
MALIVGFALARGNRLNRFTSSSAETAGRFGGNFCHLRPFAFPPALIGSV